MTKAIEMIRAFAREEDGIALTEYLILLGLLAGGVILAITGISGSLNTAWTSWNTYFSGKFQAPT